MGERIWRAAEPLGREVVGFIEWARGNTTRLLRQSSERLLLREGAALRWVVHRAMRGLVALPVMTAVAPSFSVEVPTFCMSMDAASPVNATGFGVDIENLGFTSRKDVLGRKVDLNGDGIADLIVRGADGICGTGGCPVEIYDGKSRRRIASVFGSPLFAFAKKINGWPVMAIYGHSSAESGAYATLVFDGTSYVSVSNVFLSGESLVGLFDELNAACNDARRPGWRSRERSKR